MRANQTGPGGAMAVEPVPTAATWQPTSLPAKTTISKMQITWTIGRVQIIAGRDEPRYPRDRLEINARVLMLARLIRAGEICALLALCKWRSWFSAIFVIYRIVSFLCISFPSRRKGIFPRICYFQFAIYRFAKELLKMSEDGNARCNYGGDISRTIDLS